MIPPTFLILSKTDSNVKELIFQLTSSDELGMLPAMARITVNIKLKDIERIARLQCTHREAAAFLGVRPQTFSKLLRDSLKVREAWDRGQSLGLLSLRRKQLRLADDSAPMAIFLGKQYLSQREVVTNEITGKDGQDLPINVGLLSAEERANLRKLITKGTQATAEA